MANTEDTTITQKRNIIASEFIGDDVTEGGFKTAFSKLIEYLNYRLGANGVVDYTDEAISREKKLLADINNSLDSITKSIGVVPEKSTVMGEIAKGLTINKVLDTIYPVDSVYITFTENGYPKDKNWSATWKLIDDGKFLRSASSGIGNTGGSETATINPNIKVSISEVRLDKSQIPYHTHSGTTSSDKHSHTRGTMNITGTHGGICSTGFNPTDCFYNAGSASGAGASGSDYIVGFDASRKWTGKTSEYTHTHTFTTDTGKGVGDQNKKPTETDEGLAKGHSHTANVTVTKTQTDVMNPYINVYIYKRTA